MLQKSWPILAIASEGRSAVRRQSVSTAPLTMQEINNFPRNMGMKMYKHSMK